ncbi:hypothetical protein DYI24_05620 [Rhodopseudomonas sp. BR0C11]|uniref:hypothetical protein n=1 Tax=Rhodopseudomonas sp. BR0C11 TaxID=2269370 RepID=UPI0013DF09AE|nr:hypothetical protein [Rhodopseudomonas sp. BR0C11]NEV76519.1 hypothetical protein [Rhodopseudomonas sp. BR0C11]
MKRNLFFVTASVLALSSAAAFASDNTVYLNQSGTEQKADITQEGAASSVGNNGWFIQAALASGDAGNYLSVSQTSTSNVSTSNGYQYGSNNTAHLTQSGYGSNIVLQQYGSDNGRTTSNTGPSDVITQNGTAYQSNVTLSQGGNSNLFSISQGGYQNNVTATQSGNGNQLTIQQALYYDGSYGYAYNQIKSQQYGNTNKGDYSQIGSSNQIDSTQYGNESARIYQIGYYNRSVGSQYGGGNSVNIDQGVNGTAYGTNNYASYSQSGSGLQLNLIQTGNNNQSNTIQSGIGSVANITQK